MKSTSPRHGSTKNVKESPRARRRAKVHNDVDSDSGRNEDVPLVRSLPKEFNGPLIKTYPRTLAIETTGYANSENHSLCVF